MTLRIEQSRDNGRKLSGIFVHARTAKGDWLAVNAETGQFLATDDPNVIIFRLTNGTLIHNRPSFATPRVLTFTAHDLPIDLPKFESFRVRGGRNLEYLLGLAIALDGAPRIHAIACDTDGIDGTEDNAGAIVTPDTLERARALGLDARVALAENRAYDFFEALGDLVVTGPTRTNVNDLRAILIEPES